MENEEVIKTSTKVTRKKYINESKNVVKIYSYAFMKYINDQKNLLKKYFDKYDINEKQFFDYINNKRKKIITLKNFKEITSNDVKFIT